MIKVIEGKPYISMFSLKIFLLLIILFIAYKSISIGNYLISEGELIKKGDFDYVMDKYNFTSCSCIRDGRLWDVKDKSFITTYENENKIKSINFTINQSTLLR